MPASLTTLNPTSGSATSRSKTTSTWAITSSPPTTLRRRPPVRAQQSQARHAARRCRSGHRRGVIDFVVDVARLAQELVVERDRAAVSPS